MNPSLRATYRLQFHRDFPFAAAEALAPYLKALGISHVYASPIFEAVPGSQHGYDVVDPNCINPELGGEEGFERLCAALEENGLGLILDIVPNHMAASPHNPYWMETLEFGRKAPAAALFDIDWESPNHAGKILLPVLGDPLQNTVESGAIGLNADWESGRLTANYADHVFPLAPATVLDLLSEADLTEAATSWAPLASGDLDPSAITNARAMLRDVPPNARATLEDVLADADLPAVLDAQNWRLAWWRTAADDLNYRRFFNITELIGVCVERPGVFDFTHRLVLDLVRRGKVHGLRIDHIDGLMDPAFYARRLRDAVGEGVPIFVEKILEHGEALPDWPVDGTTGYERLNHINGLFLNEADYKAFETDLRTRNLLVGTPAERLASAKRDILATSLATEIDTLATLARDGLDGDMRAADLTETAIRRGVIALIVHCPVYRSYATEHAHSESDVAVWQAIRAAIEQVEDPLTAAAAMLLLDRLEAPQTTSDRQFRLRFQQISGPAMAKGFEDTELYRNVTLLSVNEVGGSGEHPSRGIDEMHTIFGARDGAIDLIPLATHDTKRGPDTRARLNALALVPDFWLEFVTDAEALCAPLRRNDNGRVMPDDIDLRLIHQTLLAAWPISSERIATYLTKALREAKRHSSWEMPDAPYEEAAITLATTLVEADEGEPYRQALLGLLERIDPAAGIFTLAQTALQLTLPGTPDIYQGTEFRDYSLVDPDNRRPVDWNQRFAALTRTEGVHDDHADLAKFELTRDLLDLRGTLQCLTAGTYRPLEFAPSPWRWFGFVRESAGDALMVVVPTRVPSEAGALSLEFGEQPGDGWTDLDGNPLNMRMPPELSPERPCLIAIWK